MLPESSEILYLYKSVLFEELQFFLIYISMRIKKAENLCVYGSLIHPEDLSTK